MTLLRRLYRTHSADDTGALARRIGARLRAGHVVLLTGPVGAGKTHFARSLIHSLLLDPEDVPSPTFTLVQTYAAQTAEIWHADLYRLSGPDEVVELGLDEAFDTAICLIEWPDRLGDLTPDDALLLDFTVVGEDSRQITATDPDLWATILPEGDHD